MRGRCGTARTIPAGLAVDVASGFIAHLSLARKLDRDALRSNTGIAHRPSFEGFAGRPCEGPRRKVHHGVGSEQWSADARALVNRHKPFWINVSPAPTQRV